jgi:electron transfer flavoprotein alpha subunit
MAQTQAPVWVIADQIDCRILNVSFQLIGQARKLADELQTSVEVVLLGDNILEQSKELIAAGADRVYLGNSPDLSFYQPELYTEIIVKVAREPFLLSTGTLHRNHRQSCPGAAAADHVAWIHLNGKGVGPAGCRPIENRFDGPLHRSGT